MRKTKTSKDSTRDVSSVEISDFDAQTANCSIRSRVKSGDLKKGTFRCEIKL